MSAVISIGKHCGECLDRLIVTTAKASGAPLERQRRALARARKIMARLRDRPLSPARLANRLHPVIGAICRNRDPFRARKQIETQVARRITARSCPGEADGIRELMRFSALGNAIDFFRPIDQLEHWLRRPPDFGRDHLEQWEQRLRGGPRTLLWLADNAGEVFFDQPVLAHLARRGHRVVYAVKHGPVQNDLTLADLLDLNLDLAPVTVMSTGAATVGLELERASAEFGELFRAADLIVAKGMGHFETLWGRRDPRVLFLFMVKCVPVAAAAGVDVDRLVAVFEPESPRSQVQLERGWALKELTTARSRFGE